MKKKRKKAVLVILIICLVVGFGLFILNAMARMTFTESITGESIKAFYQEDRNTLDGIYVGSSAAYRTWDGTQGYEEYGFCIYNMGTYIQPITMSLPLIKECIRLHEDTQVAIVELRNLAKEPNTISDNSLKEITDAMPPSANRRESIKKFIEYARLLDLDIDYNTLDYYLPMVRDRGGWIREFELSDLTTPGTLSKTLSKNQFKGYMPNMETESFDDPPYVKKQAELEEADIMILDDFIAFAEESPVEIVIVVSPHRSYKTKQPTFNAAADYLEAAGITVLDYNVEPLRSELDIDWSTCFYNKRHLNYLDAQAVTGHLSHWISVNMDLPDHRNDPDYSSWNKAASDRAKFIRAGE